MPGPSPNSRWYISKIKARAFKSIGDRWLEIELSPGLNGIVGENGAGKSTLLDAILFCFAAPASLLDVSSLSDIRNTSSHEVCSVEVQLRAVARGAKAGAAVHCASATLTAEGTRAHRYDGRAVSGKELRAELRALGIALDSASTVIKQAAVTRLADANTPAVLAGVVGEASGASLWMQRKVQAEAEQAAAEDDTRRWEAQLAELDEMQRAGEEAQRDAQRCEELHVEAEGAAARAVALLHLGVERGRAELSALQQRSAEAVKEVDRLRAQEAACKAELEAAGGKRVAEAEAAEAAAAAGASALVEQEAAALEEVELLRAKLAQHAAAEEQCCAADTSQRLAEAAHALAADALAAAEGAHRRALADAAAVQSAAAPAQVQRELQREVGQLQAEAQQAQRAQAQAQQGANAARAAEMAAQSAQGAAEQRAAGVAAVRPLQNSAALCEALSQREAALLQLQLRVAALRHEEEVAKRRLPAPVNRRVVPLHECFAFKDPGACMAEAPALEVLAGRDLRVMVVRSSKEAEAVVNGDKATGMRLWPLDMLQVDDRSALHRQAAATFPEGDVVLPLDLVEFDPLYQPAVQRALGSHVLAANSEVAETLLRRFGVRSITPDGSVTSRGALTGGWRQEAIAGSGLMHAKLLADMVHAQAAEAQARVQQLQTEVEAGWSAVAEAERREDAAAHAARALVAARDELASCRGALEDAQGAEATAAARVHQVQAALQAKQRLLEGVQSAGDGAGAAAALSAEAVRLGAEVEAARRKELELHAELTAAVRAAAAARQRLEASAAAARGWKGPLDAAQQQLIDIQIALREHEAAAVACTAGEAEAQQVAKQLKNRLENVQAGFGAANKEAAAAVRREHETAAALMYIQRELAQAQREAPSLGAAPAAVDQPPGTLAELQAAVTECMAQRREAQAELRRRRSQGPAAPSSAADAQAVADARASLLTGLAAVRLGERQLADGVAGATPHAIAHNEALFDEVATHFGQLAGQVLCGVEMEVARVGAVVHEDGVRFRYRQLGGDKEWREGLHALSGGQRTLVSLAFIAAAAMARAGAAGGAPLGAGVLLADEIDAALDGENRAIAARLLCALCDPADEKAGGCVQVLCISHTPEVQERCSRVVKLARGPGGTTVVVSGGACIGAEGRKGRSSPQRPGGWR